MPALIWTRQALEDVQRLYRFYAGKDPDVARESVKSIREGARLLDRYPQAGRPALDISPEYREILIPFGDAGFVALYRMDGDRPVLLAIRHQKEAGY